MIRTVTLPGSPSKYYNEPVVVDGHRFHSTSEARYYGRLKLMQAAGEIDELACQWRYPLEVNGVHVCDYVADFRYRVVATGRYRTVEVKGRWTEAAKLKVRFLKACYPDLDLEIVNSRHA